jgi:hypothetical protein
MDIKKLSLSEKNQYAVTNILQSIDNTRTYCSYLENSELQSDLEEMIEKFKKKVEKKISDNF